MLHELMYQVACSARQSSYNAKQVLKQKMQETIELIHKQRQTLSSVQCWIIMEHELPIINFELGIRS